MNTLPRRSFLGKSAKGLAAASIGLNCGNVFAQTVNPTLRVEKVLPAARQPHQEDKAGIHYDDFADSPAGQPRYFEYVDEKGSFVWAENEGMRGGAMRCQFEKGQVAAGRLHVLFGKNPFGRGLRPNDTFREIYWRVYLKHEAGWEGNPAKLARATCMAGRDYSQGFIAHVWGGKNDTLCIDPATGIRESRKVTERYNDFPKLTWLGLRNARTPIFSPSESGRWVCIESHIKLNTPGEKDGVFELFVDGVLEASRKELDWHGNWQDYAINAVFLENYWNQGSLKAQSRWFDNLVISTRPIGPIVAAENPSIFRTRPELTLPWEVQVSTNSPGTDIVWASSPQKGTANSVEVTQAAGAFLGSRANKESLAPSTAHWVRIRHTGQPEWSPCHAPFITASTHSNGL